MTAGLDFDPGKGRLKHHDPASRAYEATPVTITGKPWRHAMGPVLNQGEISGCTGWSGVDWLNWSGAVAARRRFNKARHGVNSSRYLTDEDGLWLYEQATQNDNLGWTYPPTDNGSTGLGVVKALQKMGVIPTYVWTFDFQTMLGWAQRQPVMLGTLWTDNMMQPDAHGIISTGGADAVAKADHDGEGHEYCLIGGNPKTGLARIRNHWTPQWGLNGDALITFADLETLVITNRGDVAVPEAAA